MAKSKAGNGSVIPGPRESPSKGFDGMGLKLTLFYNSPQVCVLLF